MTSLRARAILGSVIWAAVTILVGGFGLSRYLESAAQEEFQTSLLDRLEQVTVALANTYQTPHQLERYVNSPVYSRPLSGDYWQVFNDEAGYFTSRSLLEGLLPQRSGFEPGATVITELAGPDEEPLLGARQNVEMEDGSTWSVQVATSLDPFYAAREDMLQRLFFAVLVIAVAGVTGAVFLTNAVLRPLAALRREVTERWSKDGDLDESAYPVEVVALVRDINTLLERNRDIVNRSRRQTADLAHAIKTPSAVMRNELEQLHKIGIPTDAAIGALDRLDAQLKRSFARMRAADAEGVVQATTDLNHSLGRMVRAFSALSNHSDKTLESHLTPDLSMRMDTQDFEEITGNLLDNAMKWSTSRIRVSSRAENGHVVMSVEDDGPGIPEDSRKEALLSGTRLDTSVPGTGLGLAIAADLSKAYGGTLTLKESDLGGLRVDLSLDTAHV